jgi:hypothetical protein
MAHEVVPEGTFEAAAWGETPAVDGLHRAVVSQPKARRPCLSWLGAAPGTAGWNHRFELPDHPLQVGASAPSILGALPKIRGQMRGGQHSRGREHRLHA